jgi:hypothetical protein
MTREIIGFLAISLVAVIALTVWQSTKKKRLLQEQQIPSPLQAEGEGKFFALYVSTVLEEAPLVRIWAHGLGMRGPSKMGIGANGISVNRVGETSFLIPTSGIRSIGRASATIDKAVEKAGLTTIHWSLGDTVVITHFRFPNPVERNEFEANVLQLIGEQIG